MRSTWLLGVGVILISAAACTSSPASHGPTATATTAASSSPQHSTVPVTSSPLPAPTTRSARPRATTATTEPRPVPVVPTSARPAPTATKKSTRQFVVRPVRADGTPASGYRVVPEADLAPTQCPDPSSVAVSRDIRFCGASAINTVACWSAASPSYVLCLRSPFTPVLARIKITGGFAPVAAPAHPSPQALVLEDGTRCVVRDGGAWDTVPAHPTWYGQYGCTNGVDVYGPIPDGIDRSGALWTVHTVEDANTAVVRSHSVTSAYLVGTA